MLLSLRSLEHSILIQLFKTCHTCKSHTWDKVIGNGPWYNIYEIFWEVFLRHLILNSWLKNGSCELKASVVECPSIPSIGPWWTLHQHLDQHSTNTQLTLNQHLDWHSTDSQSIVSEAWPTHIYGSTLNGMPAKNVVLIKYWSSVNQGVYRVSIECRSRVG